MGKKQETPVSDDLVVMHLKARKRRKRKWLLTMAAVVVIVLVAVVAGVSYASSRITEQFASSGTSAVESAEVTTGSISTTVSGSGTLTSEGTESITIPSALEIADFYVEEGDSVEEGDLIATVTSASLLTALSDLQAELDAMDEYLEEASGDEVSSSITSGVSGRVKQIYAQEDDDVATVMYEYGALMELSLDGYLAVDFASDFLAAGDSVTVELSGGDTVSGAVEKNVSGTATVLVTDDGTVCGDTVTVYGSDGDEAGSGELYIHSSMRITGYAGTVSGISVSENDSVSSGTTLFTLTDTETSVNYDTLLKERSELEEQMAELIRIKKEGGVCATISGTVESLSGSASSSEQNGMGAETQSSSNTTVAEISPDTTMSITISVDETDILSLSEGLEASVTIDSIGEDTFSGYVSEISTTASSGSGVTSYSAVVTIDKTDDMLSGMSASVVVTIEGVDDALLIPVDALHQTSSTSYVYTEYDESTGEFSGMTEVTTGLSNSSYVEITSGLSEGDVVYYTASDDSSSFDFNSIMGGDFSGGMDSGMPGGAGGDSSGGFGGMGGDSSGGMGGGMPGN